MKAAIFDVDGTLLDSMGIWHTITRRFFERRNIEMTQEMWDDYKDKPLEETLPQISVIFDLGMSADEVKAEFWALAEAEYRDNIPLKDGAFEYVRRLHDEGVRIGIATSGFEGMCADAFKRVGIADCIDAYAFSSEVGCGKDRPDVYLLAAKRLGVEPAECVVYEDIVKGIKAAAGAGFGTCALFDESNADETELLIRCSDRYITGWTELL